MFLNVFLLLDSWFPEWVPTEHWAYLQYNESQNILVLGSDLEEAAVEVVGHSYFLNLNIIKRFVGQKNHVVSCFGSHWKMGVGRAGYKF